MRNPVARYQRLLTLYRAKMHREGERHLGIPPDQTFSGTSLPPEAGHVGRLIALTPARTVLDYGSGKGQQYHPLPFADPAAAAEDVARRTASNRSSMLQDVLRGAPTEIDAICGAIVEIAGQHDLSSPANWACWQLVRALRRP